jgi:hypothetical protein
MKSDSAVNAPSFSRTAGVAGLPWWRQLNRDHWFVFNSSSCSHETAR